MSGEEKPRKGGMVIITVHLPKPYVEALDNLVKARMYGCRADAVRAAVRDLILEEIPIAARMLEKRMRKRKKEVEVE
jgi:Arc/MetJ-type ribon-helix-helix transcriptional regulator